MASNQLLSPDLKLETEMVMLRPLLITDVQHLMHYALNEPEIWQYSLISGAGEIGLINYINAAVENYTQLKEFPFIVFNKHINAFAGSTRFYDIQFEQLTLQLGYTWYGKLHQGSGINTHCKYVLLQYAFETMLMERVEFRADANNARSVKAMKKIGCVEEGILRNNTYKADGGRRDSIVLSILRNEWYNNIRDMLKRKIEMG